MVTFAASDPFAGAPVTGMRYRSVPSFSQPSEPRQISDARIHFPFNMGFLLTFQFSAREFGSDRKPRRTFQSAWEAIAERLLRNHGQRRSEQRRRAPGRHQRDRMRIGGRWRYGGHRRVIGYAGNAVAGQRRL